MPTGNISLTTEQDTLVEREVKAGGTRMRTKRAVTR